MCLYDHFVCPILWSGVNGRMVLTLSATATAIHHFPLGNYVCWKMKEKLAAAVSAPKKSAPVRNKLSDFLLLQKVNFAALV